MNSNKAKMIENNNKTVDNVNITVELNGNYGEVMSIMANDALEYDALARVLEDLEVVLATVERIDGGTKSRIRSALPETVTVEPDPDELVSILRVLEAYDLVALDGNTWVPGSALS